ncbi:Sulfurtransferase TusE [Thiorhodovibrio winogradskyi]|uniref:Sulfurtransferase TusE n=1 Tax=Thiorhodovibrio winogradskyi TaxID=77007 RepID=A0ABZ0SAD4_9GAMM|nr:TusE/DsrC/DsvC family sulfur relay protein [Thiorhodovibrio winogradskyi]
MSARNLSAKAGPFNAPKASGGTAMAPTDQDGYLLNPEDWSEAFTHALAAREGLRLTPRHWAVIYYLRGCFQGQRIPAGCCDLDTILHFRAYWPRVSGQPRWFPGLFPGGGLREQGHRLAGLPRLDKASGCRLDA